MSLTLVYAFIALLIAMTAFIHLLLPRGLKNKPLYSLLVLLLVLLILLLPINNVPVFYYLRGYLGDLSITSSVFFAAYIIQAVSGRNLYAATEKKQLLLMVALMGLFLYPGALGLGQFDPYRLGYYPQILLCLLFCSAIYFWFKAYYFLLFLVTSVVVGFMSGLLESNNLWDYLLDAVLWLLCFSIGLFSIIRSGFNRIWK